MVVQAMTHIDVDDKVDTYTLYDALLSIDVPLVITFVALSDNYTPAGICQKKGTTYLTIRLPFEHLKTCRGSALELMKVMLLSRIRHLKHMDWYNLYYTIKEALYEEEEKVAAS